MKTVYKIAIFFVIGLLSVSGLPYMDQAVAERDQSSIVAAEISAIANQLSLRPETAIDLSDVSGEYCFQVNLEKGGHMTHYAIDPLTTREDVIDFINAEPLLNAGVVLDAIPRFPGKLGIMTPNQWYYLPKGQYEPHHGTTFPFPILMKAVNVK